MNEYSCMDDAWLGVVSDIIARGKKVTSRAGDTLEIIGHAFQLSNLDATVLTNPARKMSAFYAFGELAWYLSSEAHTTIVRAYAPSYDRFTEADGTAHGAYGARIGPGLGQLRYIVEILKASRSSRQAVVSLWRQSDQAHALAGDKKDLPCTLTLQFLIRDGKLHCVTNMRSNDAWLGLPYDVFCFTSIQRLVASSLDVGLGTYTHCVGSMHLYEKDAPNLVEVARGTYNVPWKVSNRSSLDSVPILLGVERCMRQQIPRTEEDIEYRSLVWYARAVFDGKWNDVHTYYVPSDDAVGRCLEYDFERRRNKR